MCNCPVPVRIRLATIIGILFILVRSKNILSDNEYEIKPDEFPENLYE